MTSMNDPDLAASIDKARQVHQLCTELTMVLSRLGHSGKKTAEKLKSKSLMLLRQLKQNGTRNIQHRPRGKEGVL